MTLPGRERKEERIDKGLKRKTEDDGTIKEWLSKRRQQVGQAVDNAENLDWDLAGLEGGHQWAEDHDYEAGFQKDYTGIGPR